MSLGNNSFGQNNPRIIGFNPFTIGERLEIYSSVLEENRVLNIYLPHDYSPDSLKNYPVIYLLDGSIHEDFIHVAGLVQFGSYPWVNILPESIVVGIENVDRKRDFTFPTTIEEDKITFPTTGGSENFIAFIEEELQPFIDSHYKTNAVKTIVGQSLGGLLATEILIKKPNLFTNFIIVSPSLWWDNESLLELPFAPFSSPKSIYVCVGHEGRIMQRDAKALYNKIKKVTQNKPRLDFNYLKNNDHGDVLHLALYYAFEFVFDPR